MSIEILGLIIISVLFIILFFIKRSDYNDLDSLLTSKIDEIKKLNSLITSKNNEIDRLNSSLNSTKKDCEYYKTKYNQSYNTLELKKFIEDKYEQLQSLSIEVAKSINEIKTTQHSYSCRSHITQLDYILSSNIEIINKILNIIENDINCLSVAFEDNSDLYLKITENVNLNVSEFRNIPSLLSSMFERESRNLISLKLETEGLIRKKEYETKRQIEALRLETEKQTKIIKFENDRRVEIFERISKFRRNNTFLIPYISKIIADAESADFEYLAKLLDWGYNSERAKKVRSIRELKKEMQQRIEQHKWSEYQLNYLLALYPQLQDVIETEYKDIKLSFKDITETEADPVKEYLTSEEWNSLSTSEKNQLALDRYIQSHRKTKWQIGRDYELYIGYLYEKQGFSIDYFGSYMGLEDLGRDLIASKRNTTLIIQCKYWSREKEIHEKHIMQLYGSLIAYKIETNKSASGLLVTNTKLSQKAKDFAKMLNIDYIEEKPLEDFPRIKCNINYTDFGKTKIYHLPMDFQYDRTKIENTGEFMAMTVKEAEDAGFRRSYKWHGL